MDKLIGKTLLITLIGGMVFALCGCGGGGKESDATSSQDQIKPSAQANREKGRKLFQETCSTCHGMDAKGMANLGKGLIDNEFTKNLPDDKLFEFIMTGRPGDHPLNTTKVPMPPKGGNPALTDSEIYDIIAYLRSLSP